MRRLMSTISTMNSSYIAPMVRCMLRPSARSRTESGVNIRKAKIRPIFHGEETYDSAGRHSGQDKDNEYLVRLSPRKQEVPGRAPDESCVDGADGEPNHPAACIILRKVRAPVGNEKPCARHDSERNRRKPHQQYAVIDRAPPHREEY